MKVKRNSWHYKIRNIGDPFIHRENLCKYFWAIVGRIFIFLSMIFLIAMFIRAIILNPAGFIAAMMVILFILSSVILPIITINYIRNKFGKPIAFPKESLLYEYIKAKKRKICPLIDVVD